MSVRGGLTVFMHIPKTGGTTLCNILNRKYSDSMRVKSVHTEFSEIARTKARLKSPFLIHGHLGYNEVKDIPDSFTFTILRSPVSRIISHYYFLREIPTNENYHYLNRSDTTIESFYAQKTKRDLDNCLVRYLSGEHREFGSVNEHDYLLALDNLENKLDFFGLQEFYDESLLMLSKKLNWTLPLYRTRNKTKNKEQLSEKTLDFLKEANKWDVLLYEKSKAIFMEKLEALSTFDKVKLAQMKLLNKAVSLVPF